MSLVANRRPVSSYRPPIRTRDLPLPPRWTPREKAIAQRRLSQFVLASMVLHAIAIMLFGAPVGGSREGRAMFGTLNVVIREAYRQTSAPPKEELPVPSPAPKVEAAPPRPAPPLPEPVPPAPPAPPTPRTPTVQLPPVDLPPMMDRLAPSEIRIAPTVDFKPQPIETPKIPQATLQPMPTLPERSTLPPLEAPVIRIPTETPRVPAPLMQPMPTIQERSALPAIEMPVIKIPVETPKIPTPLLQPIAPLQDRMTLPPVERMPDLATPPPVPPPVIREPVAPPPAQTRAPPTEVPRTPPSSTESRPAPTESPFRTPPPVTREAPREYDPTKPSLDLDQMRKRAGELTRSGTGNRAVLPFPMPPVEKPKTTLEQAIENARKPDCNDFYKGLGLLAVLPLIANEFGEGTCKWR